ncbi:MAG: DNA-binding response regulator [Bacteroidetes bacterium]|nr:DNA-binding response regulator [Bacteroidota bacterium]
MRVVIIEDEQVAQEFLVDLLTNDYPEIQIVKILDSVKDSIEYLNEHSVDLIFMDIHLKDGNCFKIFDQINISTPIIFTTAFDEYAIKAFDVNGIYYVLKPLSKGKIDKALQKYKELIVGKNYFEKMERLLQEINPERKYRKRCLIRLGDKIISVDESNFSYFIADSGACYLYTKDNNKYIVDNTLDALSSQLDQEKYFRISRECISSFDSIKEVSKYTKGRLKILLEPQYNSPIIVSYERVSEFIKWMNGGEK